MLLSSTFTLFERNSEARTLSHSSTTILSDLTESRSSSIQKVWGEDYSDPNESDKTSTDRAYSPSATPPGPTINLPLPALHRQHAASPSPSYRGDIPTPIPLRCRSHKHSRSSTPPMKANITIPQNLRSPIKD